MPAFEMACRNATTDADVLCGFPELVFALLLACVGPSLATAIRLARRAANLDRTPLSALTAARRIAAFGLDRFWFAAPLLVPLSAAAACLAYQEVFRRRKPKRAFARTPATAVPHARPALAGKA